MGEVAFLAVAPGRLVFGVLGQTVAAAQHDVADRITEARAGLSEARLAPAILRRVMQQRANGLVFVGAVLHRDGDHAQDVGHVRNAGALAELPVVDLVGVDQRGFEASHVA